MIAVSRTFETVTPESAEEGDFADSGFIYQDRELTFRELVRELQDGGFSEPSCYPIPAGFSPWVSQADSSTNYRTGAETRESLHLADDSKARYWIKALRMTLPSRCFRKE